MFKEDLTGRRFGRLVVTEYVGDNTRGESKWKCACDCGGETIVCGGDLRKGNTKSCGCLRRQVAAEKSRTVARKANTTHGFSTHPLNRTWRGMRKRCNNNNDSRYNHYGGRGISVCEEWNDFQNFYDWAVSNGWEPGLTIDRINNDGDYCPENCRWANWDVQANNRSSNRYVTFNGETHNISEWSKLLNVNYHTLYDRLSRNDLRDFERYFNNEVNT